MTNNDFCKTRYVYEIRSKNEAQLGKEVGIVGDAFQDAGWIECEIVPESGFPTHIVFKWTQDGKPVLPIIPSF